MFNGDGDIFGHAEKIGELKSDKLNVIFFYNLFDVITAKITFHGYLLLCKYNKKGVLEKDISLVYPTKNTFVLTCLNFYKTKIAFSTEIIA